MTLEKVQYWIERVPWYIFAIVTFFFLYKLYLNADRLALVMINVTGIACFTYLATRNSLIQPASKIN